MTLSACVINFDTCSRGIQLAAPSQSTMRRDDCNGNSVVADETVLCSSDCSGECAEFSFAAFPMVGEFFFRVQQQFGRGTVFAAIH